MTKILSIQRLVFVTFDTLDRKIGELLVYLLFCYPGTHFPGNEKIRHAIQKSIIIIIIITCIIEIKTVHVAHTQKNKIK